VLKRQGSVAAVLVAVAVALVVGLGTARASATLVVDDDFGQCPSAGYSTIDDAVADAAPGDTVVVCPGIYDAATITKRLTVRGFTPGLSKASKCEDRSGYPADDQATNSIVNGLTVGASHVSISGLTLSDADNGVLVPGSLSLVAVSNSVLQDNSIGINLNGSSGVVSGNCIRDNDRPGSAQGTGIYSDQGLANATIVSNAFSGNDGAAITLIGDPAGSVSGVTVDKNTSNEDGDLISLEGVTNSTITNNTSTAAVGSAIYIEFENSFLTVQQNTLTAGEDEGIAINAGGNPVNTQLTVAKNKISGGALSNADGGIEIYDNSLTNSTFSENKVTKNGYDGLFVHAGNTGNTFSKNNLKKNQQLGAGYDCYDETGPANTWTKNKGKTSFPAGLCK
jgi:nitrous oxidase accessory protein NosD